MENPGIALILVALVLIVVGVLLGRRRNELAAQQGAKPSRRKQAQPVEPPLDVAHPRPRLVDMHVDGHEALVTFDVPFPEGGDPVLSDLLVQEALEVVREKRHSLPIDDVTSVVALAGRGGDRQRVGSHQLEGPGSLPPRVDMPSMLNLSRFAKDPLESLSESPDQFEAPQVRAPEAGDDLAPVAEEIRLPKAVDMGLRAQGIDPNSMNAIELVTGLLKLFGYTVTPGRELGQFFAEKAGSRTFILGDAHRPGDHPEVDESTINRFMADFAMSGCDRGMFVSEKYGPFEMYSRERREPRVSFVTRERLQKMVDALALS